MQDILRLRRGEWPAAAAELALKMERDADAAQAAAGGPRGAARAEEGPAADAGGAGAVGDGADSDGDDGAWAEDWGGEPGRRGGGAGIDEPATEWEVLQQAAADAMQGSAKDPEELLERARRAYEKRRRPQLPQWGSSGPSSEQDDTAQRHQP